MAPAGACGETRNIALVVFWILANYWTVSLQDNYRENLYFCVTRTWVGWDITSYE